MKIIKVFIFVLVLSVVVMACTPYRTPKDPPTPGPAQEAPKSGLDTAAVLDTPEKKGETFVEITSSGFVPQAITINAGETVTWINAATINHWVASNPHPSHTGYPGSSSSKCDTAEEKTTFDACRRMESGVKYSFTFTEKGLWGYHDHLNSGFRGTVVVE
ncbi:hypothetical protein HYX14_06710 [Candidatus Woesearchaeota archaeon]|nr:hypothetical protein [Candidatus Woesearchaeota archaeon]